jgi:hypothetical protein
MADPNARLPIPPALTDRSQPLAAVLCLQLPLPLLARIVVLGLTLFFNLSSKADRQSRVADATGLSLEAKATGTASLRDIICIGEFDAGRARLD